MNDTVTFGNWLRLRRKALDLTQEVLADRVGCSHETIRKIEAGTRRPSREMVEALGRRLAVPPEECPALVEFARSGKERSHSVPAARTNLPRPLTSFIGRQKEIEAVRSLLETVDVRLVTLTGAGGSGKTRLALQVAAQLLDSFPGGIYFVGLAPITDPSLVAFTIAQVLGVRERRGETTVGALKSHLSEKQVLLLLDNFEQVLEASPLVADLLAAAPQVKVLATSREALRLGGEHNYFVLPLSLPDTSHLPLLEYLTEYEAVQLFVDRAAAHQPDFQLAEENAQAVAEICVRLDGLPLAIELAAARIRFLPPRHMLTLLQNRLTLLTRGPKDVPARQQTLRNAIEWSYDLLDEDEERLFRRLAVFRGGRTLRAIEQVCASGDEGNQGNGRSSPGMKVLDGVESLVSKSLLRPREASSGELRYVMLETVYEFAAEKLQESGEAQELSRKHALYFMRLVEEAGPHLTGERQMEWLNRLKDEQGNIRAALQWASGRGDGTTGDSAEEAVEAGLRICAVMWRFWLTKGYPSEGREHLSPLLEQARKLTQMTGENREKLNELRAGALNGAGRLAHSLGDYASARALYEESLAISTELDNRSGIAWSLAGLGSLAYSQGDYASVFALYQESLAIFRELGDKHGIANSLNGLALVSYMQEDHLPARASHEESISTLGGSGDKHLTGNSPGILGLAPYTHWNYDAARPLHQESLALYRQLGDKQGIALSLSYLGFAAYLQGDYASARALQEESLAIFRELEDRRGLATTFNNLSAIALLVGGYASARALQEECLAIHKDIGNRQGIAFSLGNLGNVAFMQGDYASACALHKESLALKVQVGAIPGLAVSLAGLGEAAVGRGEGGEEGVVRGVRLLAAAAAQLERLGTVPEPDDQLPYEQAIASAHAVLSAERFRIAWQEGRAMSLEQAVAYALEES